MLERWIEIKLGKGDERAAKSGRLIAEEFGDEPFPSAKQIKALQIKGYLCSDEKIINKINKGFERTRS